MKKFSDIRKLKSLTNPIKEGQSAIHPITLDLIINDNDYKIVPTQFFINDIDQINYNDIYKKIPFISEKNIHVVATTFSKGS